LEKLDLCLNTMPKYIYYIYWQLLYTSIRYIVQYLQLKMINLQIRRCLLDVQSQDIVSRRMFLLRFETVRAELLLPSILYKAIALCGHCCLTATATAKAPLHHHPERKEVK